MHRLVAFVHRFSRWSLWFGGALILLAAILIGVDVVLRKAFNASIGGADELAGYALAIGTAWALGAALVDRAHIRIDSLYVFFPRTLRVVLDLAGVALLVGFFGLICWHGLGVVAQSWNSGSRSQSALQTPTVIPQSIWIAGLAVFVAVGAVLFAAALRDLLRGDPEAAVAAIGTRSAKEEVEDEIKDLKARAGDRP